MKCHRVHFKRRSCHAQFAPFAALCDKTLFAKDPLGRGCGNVTVRYVQKATLAIELIHTAPGFHKSPSLLHLFGKGRGVPARSGVALQAAWAWEYHKPGPINEPGPLASPEQRK